jgi:hypothetical protein
MVIVVLYVALGWLIFFKLRWLRWGWLTGTVTVLGGLIVAANASLEVKRS